MKNYYSDYVAHATRFYLQCDPDRGFRTEVDEKNYRAVERVYSRLNSENKEKVSDFYSNNNPRDRRNTGDYRAPVADSETHKLICAYEKEVARLRGLIA